MTPDNLLSLFLKDKKTYERVIDTLDLSYIDNLALFCANEFLSHKLDWDTASHLLNFTMAVYGFERAPALFWEVYIAFEDGETSNIPGDLTRNKLSQIKNIGF